MIINNNTIQIIKNYLYTISVALSLALFFFSNDTKLGLGKVFFVPTAFALFFRIFRFKKIEFVDIILFLFVFFGIFPYAIYGSLEVKFIELPIIRLLLGIICFRGIKDISIKFLIKFLSIITPIVLIIHYVFSDLSEYRYGGFYGDPNYLAVGFQLLIIINLLSINIFKNKLFKILCIINIIGITPLILFGLSRAGTFTMVLIFIFYWVFLYKNGKKSFYISLGIIIIILTGFSSFLQSIFAERIESLLGRFSVVQGDIRGEINRIGLQAFFSDNSFYLFGLGYGNSDPIPFYQITHYVNEFRIHNTYISVIVEQGFVGLIFFIILLFYCGKKILFSKNKYKIIKIGLFVSLLVNIYSIFCLSFLPFWFAFFFLINDWESIDGM